MKKTLYLIGFTIVFGLYTRAVWLSGFDQGTDVSICVMLSLLSTGENEPVRLADAESCQRARDYESNPLWLLRRRDGTEKVETASPIDEPQIIYVPENKADNIT